MKLFVPTKQHSPLVSCDLSRIENFVNYNAGRPDIVFTDNPLEADLIIFFEEWSFKLWTYVRELRRCSLIMDFPNKVFCINDDDYGRGFLPGLYTSLTPRNYDPLRYRACIYPKELNESIHNVSEETLSRTPSLLFSFRGNPHTHAIRRLILNDYSSNAKWRVSAITSSHHQHTEEEKLKYVEEIVDSLFILCPRGWSPSTYRLFEVMSLGRCAVIISDEWIPIDGIEWEKCSIRIEESKVRMIPEILEKRAGDAVELGINARKVWKERFCERRKFQGYLSSIMDLYCRRDQHYDERAYQNEWQSRKFFAKNGWTIEQRLMAKVRRAIRS